MVDGVIHGTGEVVVVICNDEGCRTGTEARRLGGRAMAELEGKLAVEGGISPGEK